MSTKYCVVPRCNSTTRKTPTKIFLWVPRDDRRMRWQEAIEAGTGLALNLQKQMNYYICEDHFNLADDAENWMKYKMIGTPHIKLRKEVVPHIFLQVEPIVSQLSSSEKKRRAETLVHYHIKKKATEFLTKIKADRDKIHINSVSLSKVRYQELIMNVKRAKTKTKKEPQDYKWLKKYDIVEIDGIEKLIVPTKERCNMLYYVHDEELFEILYKVHISLGHGGRDKMIKRLRKNYKNFTYKDVNIFLSLCKYCIEKHQRERKTTRKSTQLCKELNSKSRLCLIDFQSKSDGEFKFILLYEEISTKFVTLKALKSNEAEEVANNLFDIFATMGAPVNILSEHTTEFVEAVIDSMRYLWPHLKVVIENDEIGSCVKGDIEKMLAAWMQKNETSNWSKGLGFVQFARNKLFHPEVNKSPFEALFGHPAQLGLCSSNIPFEKLVNIKTEEELEEIMESIDVNEEISNSNVDETMEGIEEYCIEKHQRERKTTIKHTQPCKELNSKSRFCLIDLQSKSDGEFKFILLYEEISTKFVTLKALKSNEAEEVANNLFDIFATMGAPVNILSEHTTEFVEAVIDSMRYLWPHLKVVIENDEIGSCVKGDIEKMLAAWMQKNETSNWSKGLGFVQFARNKLFHPEVHKSPFEAFFGHPAQLGLCSSNIPFEKLVNIKTEEELEKIMESINVHEEISNSNVDETVEEIEEYFEIKNEEEEKNSEELILTQAEFKEEEENSEEFILPQAKFTKEDGFLNDEISDSADATAETEEAFTCGVCQILCDSCKQCVTCGNFMHDLCESEEGSSMCLICDRKQKIQKRRQDSDDLICKIKKVKQTTRLFSEKNEVVWIQVTETDPIQDDATSILGVIGT